MNYQGGFSRCLGGCRSFHVLVTTNMELTFSGFTKAELKFGFKTKCYLDFPF